MCGYLLCMMGVLLVILLITMSTVATDITM